MTGSSNLRRKFDSIFYGYGDYFIRLLLVAWRSNWKILEVPVFYILRRHGDSKTGFWDVFEQYTRAVFIEITALWAMKDGRRSGIRDRDVRSDPRSSIPIFNPRSRNFQCKPFASTASPF